MAKIKVLTREELCEIKKEKAQKRAKAWLINQDGICTHIPKNLSLVELPIKEEETKETITEKAKEIKKDMGITAQLFYGAVGLFIVFVIKTLLD